MKNSIAILLILWIVSIGTSISFWLAKPFDPSELIDVSEAVEAARKAEVQREAEGDAGIYDWTESDAGMHEEQEVKNETRKR